MGLSPDHPAIRTAIANGLIAPDQLPPTDRRRRRTGTALVAPAFALPASWTIPLETRAEANRRDWRGRSRRSDAAWRAVSRAFGPHLAAVAAIAAAYHAGQPVEVRLTRLGGRPLDRTVNLPSALKGVEDAVAFFLGADDADPRWHCACFQEPGGPMGVVVELSIPDAER